MRTLRWLAAVVILCGVACSSTQSTSGSGGGGPGVDAGSGDAGTAGGGGADAGSGSGGSGGGSTDAGSSGGGGSADAGTGSSDGGTASNECDGLGPGATPSMVTFQTFIDQASGETCGLPIGDGAGALALRTSTGFHPKWLTVASDGHQTGSFDAWQGEFWGNNSGFIGYLGSSAEQVVMVEAVDARGNATRSTAIRGDTAVFAPDPNGGLFAVGHLTLAPEGSGPPAKTLVVAMFNADASLRSMPLPLGIGDPAVFGAGVDQGGRAVVIYDGGGGNIDAIWIDSNGVPGTGFTALTNFRAGPSTWFETSPLIGGGVALRRMDAPGGADEHRTSAWLALLPALTPRADPPPQWLVDRPNTGMTLARSGRAYALSPWSTDVAPCDQAVEIVSPSGNSCGKADFAIDGNACQTRDLRIASDGTVMQMLPASREHFAPGSNVAFSCTLRFWPAALR